MSRRLVLSIGTLAIVGLLAVASCAPAAAPTPTAAPQKPAATAAPAKPAAEKPAAGADLKAQWDNTLAAAKKEGKVVVVGAQGELNRNAAMGFQKAYPDIRMEYVTETGSSWWEKVFTERSGGQYLYDVHIGGSSTMILVLKPKGLLDPIKPALLLPDVLDNSKWVGGLEAGWIDNDGKYVFGFTAMRTFTAHVNRDVIPEAELTKIDQLLDPKWKGKIISGDPRSPGASSSRVGYMLQVKGEDWLRKFLPQIVVTGDVRQQAEGLVRGRYPIGFAVNMEDLTLFQEEGVGKNVKPLEPDSPEGAALVSARGNVILLSRAANPNAAKVYLNWLLSREGQQAYTDVTKSNSLRVDVKGPPATAPVPGLGNASDEDSFASQGKARDIAKELLK